MTEPDPLTLIDISVHSGGWEPQLETTLHTIEEVVKVCRSYFPLLEKKGHVDVVLADDELLQSLNASYRHKDKPTNVLSFPQDDLSKGQYLPPVEFVLLGDIVLSYSTLQQEAVAQKKVFSDHLQHLIVHGFLHLLGFDHAEEDEAQEMEALEIKILESLGVPNPYQEDEKK
ncbi:MAG: rRNA maturation RNase YbeY [Alphaproteobacteria bacterium]